MVVLPHYKKDDKHVQGIQRGCVVCFKCPYCVKWRRNRFGEVFASKVYHKAQVPDDPKAEVRLPCPCPFLCGWFDFDFVVHVARPGPA